VDVCARYYTFLIARASDMIARGVYIFGVLLLVGATSARGQEGPPAYRGVAPVESSTPEPSTGRRLVAVIGIDQYNHWPSLKNAKSDAVATSKLFEDSLGFTPVAPPLLDGNATKEAILHFVDDELRRELKPDDDLVLFFAGHGTTRKDRVGGDIVETGYLVPVEALAPGGDDERWSDYIQLEPFLKSIGILPARHILVILDSCRSGIALESAAAQFTSQELAETPLAVRLSRKVITSARGDQQAQDNGPVAKHSLFTGMLINGFETGKVDLFRDNTITSTEIGLYLENAVGRYPHAGQTPDFGSFFADKRGDMYLAFKTYPSEGSGASHPGGSVPVSAKPTTRRGAMSPRRIVPLTGAPGLEGEPKFSPDGKKIAYEWEHGDAENTEIYVKSSSGGQSVQLTQGADDVAGVPLWSADGQQIIFTKYFKDEAKILSVPALGGLAKELASLAPRVPFSHAGYETGMDISHDGKYLAFPDKESENEPFGLFLFNLATGERRRITTPVAQDVSFGDFSPVFSPDDQHIAFVRSRSLGIDDVYVMPASGGEPQRLTADNARLFGLTWMPDGQSLVFASKRIGSFALWRVSIADGSLEDLGVSGDLVASPAVSPDGKRLAFVEVLKNVNLWRFDTSEARASSPNPIELVASAKIETGAQYSPDGKKIAFESTQSGDPEIWICDSDGANPTQLTNLRGPVTGTPRWSPDSRTVAFDSRAAGTADIYSMSIDDNAPRRLTEGKGDSHVPSWSADGQFVFFASNRTGRNEIWKLPIKGGPEIQLTHGGGFAPLPSPDGRFVYYAKGPAVSGLWRVPVGGGAEEEVLDQLCAGCWGLWAVSDHGIYFAMDPAGNHRSVQFFDFGTKRISSLFAPPRPLPIGNPGLALSPDGRFLLYSEVDQDQSNVMVMDVSQ